MEYKRVTITLPKHLAETYKRFVEENGLNMSGRIALLVKEDLKNKTLKS
jgi:metal-responsive CopG/Arc/MetJ family transcriptional regulator